MSIDSVGVSNTAGYSFTGGDPISTGGIVGLGNGISSYTQMGGGKKKKKKKGGGKTRKKTKQRRSISKRVRLLAASKIRGVKKSIRKKRISRACTSSCFSMIFLNLNLRPHASTNVIYEYIYI